MLKSIVVSDWDCMYVDAGSRMRKQILGLTFVPKCLEDLHAPRAMYENVHLCIDSMDSK